MLKNTNVIIIMADQLRYDVLGGEYTPNINMLAKESVVFNRAYCTSPLCVPARGSFFTGRYPNETGSIINPWVPADACHGNVRAGMPNLYSIMENEWDSWHIGKQHFITEEKIDVSPETKTNWTYNEEDYKNYLKLNGKQAPGGKVFKGITPEMVFGRVTQMRRYNAPGIGCYKEGFDYYYDGYFVKGAIEAIRSRDKNKPFLLNAMFLAPHPPFDIPEPWYSTVKEFPLPENVGKWSKNQSPLQLYNMTGAMGTRYKREDWGEIWPVYIGLVSLLDDCVGMIINELKEQGMYDDTLIIFTSDHGEMLGSHCLWQKMCMYEESVRIPLYFKFPKGFEPMVTESSELVSGIDVFPTICDYLGLDLSEKVSGISLMPVIQNNSLNRNEVFIQFDGNGARGNFQRCVVNGGYKLIVDIFKDEYFLELYNVAKDPQELCNLAFETENKTLILGLINSLESHMERTGDLLKLPKNLYEKFIEDYFFFKN